MDRHGDAAADAGRCAVEATGACLVTGPRVRECHAGQGVQMQSKKHIWPPLEYCQAALAHQAGPRQSDAVGQMNVANAEFDPSLDDLEHRFDWHHSVIRADERNGHAQGYLYTRAYGELEAALNVPQVLLDRHV